MITDLDIIKKFNECNCTHNKRAYLLKHVYTSEELEYIKNRYSDSLSINESLDRIINHIEIRPKCKYCGKEIEYVGRKQTFRTYCSNECKLNDTNMLERHKSGCLKKYGVDNISKVNNIKDKKIKTHLKNYGTKNNFGMESTKETIIKKYGVDNISKLDEIKEKKKQTSLLHYGVETFLQHEIAREKRKSEEAKQKEYNTKLKNGTFNTSSYEEESYILLKEKYPDIIRQYKSKEYPYLCDFYIHSKKLYIECNYHWTHGEMIFDSSNEICINKLNEWKNRNTKYYKIAIDTWTIRDIKKRNIAKENNLNWIEFFNIEELKEWVNNN